RCWRHLLPMVRQILKRVICEFSRPTAKGLLSECALLHRGMSALERQLRLRHSTSLGNMQRLNLTIQALKPIPRELREEACFWPTREARISRGRVWSPAITLEHSFSVPTRAAATPTLEESIHS